jgi:hypothetical protein
MTLCGHSSALIANSLITLLANIRTKVTKYARRTFALDLPNNGENVSDENADVRVHYQNQSSLV